MQDGADDDDVEAAARVAHREQRPAEPEPELAPLLRRLHSLVGLQVVHDREVRTVGAPLEAAHGVARADGLHHDAGGRDDLVLSPLLGHEVAVRRPDPLVVLQLVREGRELPDGVGVRLPHEEDEPPIVPLGVQHAREREGEPGDRGLRVPAWSRDRYPERGVRLRGRAPEHAEGV